MEAARPIRLAPGPSAESAEDRRSATFAARVRSLVRAIEENDEAKVEEAILRLSRSRRTFAPLAFAISAFVMLFQGLRLLVSNWRLTLVQILPAMWIWLAMLDLKAHVLHGKSFHVLRGPVLIPIVLLIVMLTVMSFFLNAVFAFTIAKPAPLEIRPAAAQARRALDPDRALGSGGRAVARVLDDHRHTLGPAVVHDFAGDRRRRDDGQLRRHALAADRREEATTINARQTVDERGDRGSERDRVHAALHPRKARDPDARIEHPADSWDLPARARTHAPSRRDRRSQSHQDERDPHHGSAAQAGGRGAS